MAQQSLSRFRPGLLMPLVLLWYRLADLSNFLLLRFDVSMLNVVIYFMLRFVSYDSINVVIYFQTNLSAMCAYIIHNLTPRRF